MPYAKMNARKLSMVPGRVVLWGLASHENMRHPAPWLLLSRWTTERDGGSAVGPKSRERLLNFVERHGLVSCYLSGSCVWASDFRFLVGFATPCVLILCKKSTMTSFSWVPRPLKCFRAEVASRSLLCRRKSFRLAIVGDCRPMPPGWARTHRWYSFSKALGVLSWYTRR